MKKIIFRFLIFTLLLIFGFITYLSTIGIKTDVFNDQISKEVKKIDNQLELDLEKISIILDPFKFKLVLKTVGANLKNKNKLIYLTTNSGYGVGEKNKFCDEDSPLNPISLYGKTKCDAEREVLKYKNTIAFRLATVFGSSFRMRSDLLVNNFAETAIKKKKLSIFEPHFRRNYIHVRDVVKAIIFSIQNFNKLRSNIFNLGLSSANITKIQLAKKMQKKVKNLKINISKNKKDPDQRDYFVSNKKIEKKGFKASISLDNGIDEMLEIFKLSDTKIINNY